ncbi:uncharacterized protein [Dysidea avara]|uniref:uncharacterized protein isoform X2 n=1 Tax=Dysidea avara TaxID=196820 RepID=UPI00331B129D
MEGLRTVIVVAMVSCSGAPPHVDRFDFSYYIPKHKGNNLNLTTNISSNIPLSSGYPQWIKDFRLPLPSTAVVDNYTTGGVRYSRLSLYDLSFEDDTGNYTNTVKNQCGSSFVYIYIDVMEGTKTGGNHGTTNKLYIYIIIGIVVGILAVVAVIVILYCGRGRLKNWCSKGGSREQIDDASYRLITPGDEIQDESIQVPSVPTNLTADALSHDQIKITWGPVTDNCGANEYRFVLKVTNKDTGTQECGDIQLRGDQRVTTCNGLKNSTEYRIQLAAVNCKGCSNFAEATVRTLASVPSAPTNLTAEALSHDQIKITWEPVTDNGGADVNNFVLKVIEMDTSTRAFDDRQFRGDQMEATPNGLKNNIEYKIQLAAVNRAGWSDFAEATVRTLASELQNISIGEKARQRPLVQIKDFDSVYSDLSHGAVHKWKEIGLKLGLKSCELNEISADYKDDPEENMKKVFELWKDQSLNPTWKELIAAVERTRLNPQLSQTLRIVHQNEIDDEVQSKDCNNVLTSMAKHWFDFGLKLGIDEIQLNNIMPATTKTFFTNMLQKWWQQNDAVSQTWNHVVSALDAVKLSGLAKIIYDSRIKQADNFVDDDI